PHQKKSNQTKKPIQTTKPTWGKHTQQTHKPKQYQLHNNMHRRGDKASGGTLRSEASPPKPAEPAL
ncbi:hypothetical protein, partial [Stappia sp. TSB10GB4]|uniref:hypothetical protein n=1 Tax=Stappia sp. TSB10GB4 TaxID=2003584 RepID=UPI001AD901C4